METVEIGDQRSTASGEVLRAEAMTTALVVDRHCRRPQYAFVRADNRSAFRG
jgi:hypothetical protein